MEGKKYETLWHVILISFSTDNDIFNKKKNDWIHFLEIKFEHNLIIVSDLNCIITNHHGDIFVIRLTDLKITIQFVFCTMHLKYTL